MENLQKEFVPYDRALKMKELGFDEPCFKVVEGGPTDIFPYEKLDVPIYQQAFRWFREKYGLCSWIERMYTADSICYYRYTCEYKKDPLSKTHEVIVSLKEYDNYEEAELACLKKLFEIVEEKQKEDGR